MEDGTARERRLLPCIDYRMLGKVNELRVNCARLSARPDAGSEDRAIISLGDAACLACTGINEQWRGPPLRMLGHKAPRRKFEFHAANFATQRVPINVALPFCYSFAPSPKH